MRGTELEIRIVDQGVYDRTAQRFRDRRIRGERPPPQAQERYRVLNLVHYAIISDPDHLEATMDGEAGTTIVPG